MGRQVVTMRRSALSIVRDNTSTHSKGAACFNAKRQEGFSLLELLIVCALVSIAAGLAISSFSERDQAIRLAADIANRLRERRASAIRINALTEPTLLENFSQPPISIDFSNPSTTAPLVVEGNTSTSFNVPAAGTLGFWTYVYQGTPLNLSAGWHIARSAEELTPISLIPLGTPATIFNFTADGSLDSSSLPPASPNTDPEVESPFPVIYVTDGRTARAVAVHPSGLVEVWQYDEATSIWKGFGNRSVTPNSLTGTSR